MLQTNASPVQRLRIVVADDKVADREAVVRLLKAERDFRVEEASSYDDLMALIADGDVDCITIDQVFGTESGFAVRDRLRAKYRYPPAVIMLTGTGSENAAIKAFRCGFDNYLKRNPLQSKALTSAILDAVARKRAETLQRNELERLARLALLDRMTGLPHRKVLDDRLTMLVASGNGHSRQFAEKRGTDFAILLIDINAFGNINDRFGHDVGDAALKGFADKLRQVARKSDLFGRFGGDEFYYLIERAMSVDTTDLACRRLIDALAFSIELESVGLSLSCSVGAAIYPRDGETAAGLTEAAERALQSAKAVGGGYQIATMPQAPSEESRATSPATIADSALASSGEITSRPGQPATADAALDEGTDSHAGAHREQDRRSDRRQRVLKRGMIVTNDGYSTVDCVIRDLSAGGARIAVAAEYAAHPQFNLLIVATGERLPVERRWQHGRDIGVKFLV